jgi:TRAP-type C4-dicarboxylate transport system substrate-binding protein
MAGEYPAGTLIATSCAGPHVLTQRNPASGEQRDVPAIRLLVLAASAFAFASTALAQELRLTFATLAPPSSRVAQGFFHPWAQRINEAGKGIVRLEVKDGFTLANLENVYNRVLDDVVQVGWGLQSAIGGKFERSAIAGLPFTADDSERASVALWRLYKSSLIEAEYQDIVPLALVVFPQSGLHLARAPAAPDNIAGLKLAALGKVQGDAIGHLGAVPLSLPATDLYEGIQRGLADGAVASWTTFDPFRLGEVTRYHVVTRLGTSTGMLFMARKKFEALPAEVRRILQENSGESSSRQFGGYLDADAARVMNQVKASEKNTVVVLSDEITAQWRDKVAPVGNDWVNALPNGPVLRAAFEALLKEARTAPK